jgi:hypothetical protein
MADLKVQPGGVQITQCTILKQDTSTATDVLTLVESITLYEDLFSPFMTGKIKLRDTLDFLNSNGRLGPDLVKIRVQPPEVPKEFWIDDVFVIYKIADRTIVSDRAQTYSIYFASVEMLRDINSSISRKFEGSCVDVITKIAQTYLKSGKNIISDEPGSNVTYVSNFWNPTKNFSFIADRAYGKNGDATFLFYENRDGFNFKSISSLMAPENKIIQKFVASDYNGVVGEQGTMAAGVVTRDMKLEYANILGVRIDMTYDFVKDYLDGALATKLYSNDPVTKKIRYGTYNSTETPSALNPNHLYPENIVSVLNPLIGSINRTYGMFVNREYSNYARVQKRTSVLRSIQSSKVEIDVYGQTHYTVGRKVNLNMNQLREILKVDTEAGLVDKLYSGNYIITAISHQIGREGYKATLELSKESTILA